MPFRVFAIPATDDGTNAEVMNAFLRTVRVVSVERQAAPPPRAPPRSACWPVWPGPTTATPPISGAVWGVNRATPGAPQGIPTGDGPWPLVRFQPREPGRQLKQQRQELPVREPQQEHAGQPEHQPWVPGRCPAQAEQKLCVAQPSSSPQVVMRRRWNDPTAHVGRQQPGRKLGGCGFPVQNATSARGRKVRKSTARRSRNQEVHFRLRRAVSLLLQGSAPHPTHSSPKSPNEPEISTRSATVHSPAL